MGAPSKATDPPSEMGGTPAGVQDPSPEAIDPLLEAIEPPSELRDPLSEAIGPSAETKDPPAEVPDPPIGVPGPPANEGLDEGADAVQGPMGVDFRSTAPKQRALHAGEVQPAKPKMMIPTFRRCTPALPISTIPLGPTHHEGLVKPPNREAPNDVVGTHDGAAEDMISDEPENGDCTAIQQTGHSACVNSHLLSYHAITYISGHTMLSCIKCDRKSAQLLTM